MKTKNVIAIIGQLLVGSCLLATPSIISSFDPQSGSSDARLSKVYIRPETSDRYFVSYACDPANVPFTPNIVATVEDPPKTIKYGSNVGFLFSTEDTTIHRIKNGFSGSHFNYPTLASSIYPTIVDRDGTTGSNPQLGWIETKNGKTTRGVLNLGLASANKNDQLLTVPSVHYDRIPNDSRLLDPNASGLSSAEKTKRGNLLMNPWSFIYYGVQSQHVLSGSGDTVLSFSHTEHANDARNRLSDQTANYRSKIGYDFPWGYWAKMTTLPHYSLNLYESRTLDGDCGPSVYPSWTYSIDDLHNWFYLETEYEVYLYQNLFESNKTHVTQNMTYDEWQNGSWASEYFTFLKGDNVRTITPYYFRVKAYNDSTSWYDDTVEVFNQVGDYNWLDAAYSAYVTYAFSPIDASSGLASGTIDYGPCVWPTSGYFNSAGTTRTSEGVSFPSSVIVDDITSGNKYVYVAYYDRTWPRGNKVARALISGSGQTSTVGPFYNWSGTYDSFGNPEFNTPSVPSINMNGTMTSLRTWLDSQNYIPGYPRKDSVNFAHLDVFKEFMKTPAPTPSPNLSLSDSGPMSIAKVKGQSNLFVSVQGVTGSKFAIRVSNNLVDWSSPIYLNNIVMNDISLAGSHAEFLSLDGLSNTEIDLNNFFVIMTPYKDGRELPLGDALPNTDPNYGKVSYNQVLRYRLGLTVN